MAVLPLLVCGAAAALYALGRRGRVRPWREACFYSGVALTLVVLQPPFDTLADRWLAVHMTQHVILMTVVPPLVVLGRPWPRLWLVFPLGARRAVGGALAGSAAFRSVGSTLSRPPIALLLQTAAIAVWHVPSLYDAAVRNDSVHLLEHTCFVAPALLYWGALLDAPPVRTRMDQLRRSVWFAAAMVPGWILAIVLAFARAPVYTAYPKLGDQQLAAGVMWVPGSLAYFVFAFLAFYRWLEPAPAGEPRPEELSWT
ncbi:MAG TPA: cytochrome c oxidase assembly protein [Gaiellaceae bacterium]|nr:cytochrome c oxidase assembly protein [Gaiellaceae bacterium]